ncbi:hypothetical protein [Kitasatospora sp. NPDC087271]|uniref:hypothetical protein n=1 Tax=Kitasatospora sp. NPDC087271 TaxID=3364067 RepID=UPI003823913A
MRRRWLLWGSLLSVVVLLLGAGGWVVYRNEYDLREGRVTITGGRQALRGVLARPSGGRTPAGLVVLVHGDGPTAPRSLFSPGYLDEHRGFLTSLGQR